MPIIEVFSNLNPVMQALLATLFTCFLTALGAATVFVGRELNQKILDWLLGFAAGAMIFVIVEDLIPESHRAGHVDLATTGVMVGFAVMMVLVVAFG